MPTIEYINLHPPVTVGLHTTVTVSYQAEFSDHEQRLAALLMPIRETFTIQGMDGNVATMIATFTRNLRSGVEIQSNVANPNGNRRLLVDVYSEYTIERAKLQEDPVAGDNDEIRVRIDLTMGEFPAGVPKSPISR